MAETERSVDVDDEDVPPTTAPPLWFDRCYIIVRLPHQQQHEQAAESLRSRQSDTKVMYNEDSVRAGIVLPAKTCITCRTLDWAAVYKSKTPGIRVRYACRQGPRDEHTVGCSSCPVCQLIRSLVPLPYVWDESEAPQLVFSTEDLHTADSYLTKNDDPTWQARIRIKTWSRLSRNRQMQSAEHKITRFPQSLINDYQQGQGSFDNFDELKDKLQTCLQQHVSCQRSSNTAVLPLRLINCHNRNLVQTPANARYLALSYVWGQEDQKASDISVAADITTLPSDIPLAIQDALVVTTKMGFDYLWVDRYCIDQDNEELVKHEIGVMNSIYANATITLVAAAGHDPTHGLPGVSQPRQRSNINVSLGSITLTAIPDPTRLIAMSKWSTRAWTFQEAFCSPRLLFFTEQEVVFTCAESSLCENFYSLNQTYEYKNYKDVHVSTSAIWNCINVYARRDLGRQSDALNAFLGVLRTHEAASGCDHYWGIPLSIEDPYFMPEWAKTEVTTLLVAGLRWENAWQTQVAAARRRLGFPSWTWLGWNNLVCVEPKLILPDHEDDWNLDIVVMIDLNGQPIAWEELHRKHWETTKIISKLSPYLLVRCWTLDLEVCLAGTERTGCCMYHTKYPHRNRDAVIFGRTKDGRLFGGDFALLSGDFEDMSHGERDTAQRVTGLVMCPLNQLLGHINSFILVVQSQGDCCERIGHFIDWSNDYVRKWNNHDFYLSLDDLQLDRRIIRLG